MYSDSVLSLKPDENHDHNHAKGNSNTSSDNDNTVDHPRDRLLNRPPTPMEPTTIEHTHFSDEDSEIDYSDMIYQRKDNDCLVDPVTDTTKDDPNDHIERDEGDGSEDEDDGWKDTAIDPFADVFDIQESNDPNRTTATIANLDDNTDEKKPALKVLDPTLISRKVSKVSPENHSTAKAIPDGPRRYEEKESNEIEIRSPQYSLTPAQPPNIQYSGLHPQPLVELDLLAHEEQPVVLPTNTLRASKPPPMSPTNPYHKSQPIQKQHAVPATDYGYFKDEEKNPFDRKSLPNLPIAS
ncbi:hypothetical protein BD560DRAFT_400067, partial [Blakeslea trispora]